MTQDRRLATSPVGLAPAAAVPPFGRLISPVLVSRERELALLLEAATHVPALVVIQGEAGVGKTRLVHEFLARPELGKRQHYLGGCQQLSEPFPLSPLVEALRGARPFVGALTPLAGALQPLLPELSSILPPLPEPIGERRAERHRQFRALRELLGALGPAVLVLEDLHWADEATVELLRFLAPQLPPGLTLVCTYRQEDLAERSPLLGLAVRLPNEIARVDVWLRPLDREQVRELARTILESEDVSDEFADYLFAGSGGLPFAVEELLRLLEERKDLTRRQGVWVRRSLEEIGVPKPVQDSILERVRRLGGEARAVLQASAVLALPADEQLILEVADLSEDMRPGLAFVEALSSALLCELEDGVYGFRHVLARQAVAEAIPTPLRRRLHLRAAQALVTTRPKPLARLAHHYRAAGKTTEWIHYAEALSDRALSLEDDAMAFRLLKEAVTIPGLSAATRGRLAVKLATHAQYCLAHGEAIDMLRQLLDDAALTRGTRGELRLWLARLLIHDGEMEGAQSETALALDDLKTRPALAAQAMSQLALPWVTGGRIETQQDWLALAMETVANSADRAARIAVAADRAASLLFVGDPAGWQAVEEIPAPGPADDEIRQAMRACANLADALVYLGYYERAGEHVREGLRLRAQMAHSIEFFSHRLTELQLDWVVGRWEGLEERARYFAEEWEDWAVLRGKAQAVLGLVLLARGEVQAALKFLDPLAKDFRGEAPMLGWVAGALVRVRLAQGKSEAAADVGLRSLETMRRSRIWVWAAEVAPVTVEALLAAGRPNEARELTRQYAAGLKTRDAPAAAAALAVCRAHLGEVLGEPRRAARAYLAAERAWTTLPRPHEAARARQGAGRCMLASGVEGGRELLVEAMDAFNGLGAAWDAGCVRRTLRQHGVTAPKRSGRRSYGDELSPRQAEVARLAARGLTNREIALELFLSPKTVENYLRAAMHKLDVTSRTTLPQLFETAAK